MKILLIKISSMGDLIHTLPALTDAANQFEQFEVHWVAEESFLDVPNWHQSVTKIIPIAHRRWKKNWLGAWRNGELSEFYKAIRHEHYDLVIDAQSNLKSAISARLARGHRVGVNKQSVHENGAQWFYQTKLDINKNQHAVDRMRQIFSKALKYELPETTADYQIDLSRLPKPDVYLPENFILLNHHASRDYKLWPETYWFELINYFNQNNLAIVLPWGSTQEHQRAKRFAEKADNALVLPEMSLSNKAAVISQAKAAISCDTGLGHLAAALNIPSLSFYGPTDPKLVGTIGQKQIHMISDFPCSPCKRSACHYDGEYQLFPACLERIKPNAVIGALKTIL